MKIAKPEYSELQEMTSKGYGVGEERRQRRDVLFVVNKQLPPGDYRVQYALSSSHWKVKLGMPLRTPVLPASKYQCFGFEGGVSPADLLHFWRLLRYLQINRDRLCIVHFYSTKLVLFGPVLARLAGVRCISTITGFGRAFNDARLRYRLLRRVYLHLIRLSARFTSAVLFQNRGDMEEAKKWMGDEAQSRLQYIGSATVGRRFTGKCFTDYPLTVLMVARLLPSKGIDDFIDVATDCAGNDIRFVLVGPQVTGGEAIYRRVMAAHKKGTIEFRGELHDMELRNAYEQAHVFLFTSYGEGMPRVMLEAGFAGCCPIAYEINACRDLVLPGSGFLIPLRDHRKIIDVIHHLHADRATLRDAAHAFQASVVANYSFHAYERRLNDVLSKVSGDAGGQEGLAGGPDRKFE